MKSRARRSKLLISLVVTGAAVVISGCLSRSGVAGGPGKTEVVPAPHFDETVVVDAGSGDASGIPQQYLDAARTKKVLFNHQSVGANLLDGLASLSQSSPQRYQLERSHAPDPAWYSSPTTGLGDFTEGQNGQPISKLAGFDGLIRASGYGSRINVAVMKFCYADMGVLPPQQLWDRYRKTMQALQRDYPSVTFVWTTVPLTSGDNSQQKVINDAVRSYVQRNGGVLFDIASLESVPPNGPSSTGRDGSPRLAAAYDSGDGGHLNTAGKERLASAWWQLMARVAGWKV